MSAQHLATNKANWDARAPLHASRRSGYKTQAYIDDRTLLSNVVQFDLARLPSLLYGRVTHLQCHIGTDTLSLARLGGSKVEQVVGLDFSSASLGAARALVKETGDAAVTFVEADVYDAPSVLEGEFDLVFTGIGALCWLPDITKWAAVVACLLKPGGRLFMREGHPIVAAVDERITDALGPVLRFPYFQTREPLEWDDDSTYVDVEDKVKATKTYNWNHGVGEVVTALLGEGLVLELLEEHDTLPYRPFEGMEKRGLDEWGLKDACMPLSYTVIARKPLA